VLALSSGRLAPSTMNKSTRYVRRPLLWALFATLSLFAGCSSQVETTAAAPEPASAPLSHTAHFESAAPSSPDELKVCSFNIQFLGSSAKRDNAGLAEFLKNYDIVVVQELTAAPATNQTQTPGSRQRSAVFFREMAARGFQNVLSESDTGKTGPLPNYGTATEWFVTFYKPGKVIPANDLPHGFIGQPLAAHPTYDRVPYAFAFRSANGHADFVLISVHLNPDLPARRKVELAGIGSWMAQKYTQAGERDYIVLGDMNLQNVAELHADTPVNFISLNEACVPTNTNVNGPKPYDHVMFNPTFTTEIDRTFGFKVVNLIDAMRPTWTGPGTYPGGPPYRHDDFRFAFSDHHPVVFRIKLPAHDDDN